MKSKRLRLKTSEFDNIVDLLLKFSKEVYNVDLSSDIFYDKLPKNSKFKKIKYININVKGPTSAFIYFTKRQNIENTQFDIFKMKKSYMSGIWARMSLEEKEPYLKLAELDRSRYNQAIEYTKKEPRSKEQTCSIYINYRTDSDEDP